MRLYPILPRTPKLEALAIELAKLKVAECRMRRRLSHSDTVVSPTGGAPASERHLRALAEELTSTAEQYGYPNECKAGGACDLGWAVVLHEQLDVSPHEAAADGMWHFMTCVLVPDLVRWRWGGASTEAVSERWVTVRRSGRNCFGRLWWRANVLQDSDCSDAYALLKDLGEDEVVQIMERPNLAGNRFLARATARAVVDFSRRHPSINRGNLLREVQKRLMRYGAFIEFQALEASSLSALLSQVIDEALEGARSR
jgi:hypothetical protein